MFAKRFKFELMPTSSWTDTESLSVFHGGIPHDRVVSNHISKITEATAENNEVIVL